MKYYDISVSLSERLPSFPGDPNIEIADLRQLDRGDAANVSKLSISCHAGTHIDAPLHYLPHGISVDYLPLSLFVGEAKVIQLAGGFRIGRAELARHNLKGSERVILKTGNSALWEHQGFSEAYAALTEEGAEYLADCGVKLVGIDYLSVEPFDSDGSVHRLLLSRGVVILEGLNLDGVDPGIYELICLPLKIKGGEAAPARAVLRRRDTLGKAAETDLHTTKWPLA